MSTDADVIVVGGGISGMSLALLGARSGLKIILLEQSRLGGGASGNSLRIIHGGLRYLQNLALGRSVQSILAQQKFKRDWADHVRPLTCLLPLEGNGLQKPGLARWGARFYKILGRILGAEVVAEVIDPRALESRFSNLKEVITSPTLMWQDLELLNPDNFINALGVKAAELGTEIKTNVLVGEISRLKDKWLVKTSGAGTYAARCIVNTAGIGAETIKLSGVNKPARRKWCLGYNVILKRKIFDNFALALKSSSGRSYFLVPRDALSVVGTGYYQPASQSFESAKDMLREKEAPNFLKEFAELLPSAKLGPDDIAKVECGFLPQGDNTKQVLPATKNFVFSENGYFELQSVKYTTCFTEAEAMLGRLRQFVGI